MKDALAEVSFKAVEGRHRKRWNVLKREIRSGCR